LLIIAEPKKTIIDIRLHINYLEEKYRTIGKPSIKIMIDKWQTTLDKMIKERKSLEQRRANQRKAVKAFRKIHES
jgi:hypothetical protein